MQTTGSGLASPNLTALAVDPEAKGADVRDSRTLEAELGDVLINAPLNPWGQ